MKNLIYVPILFIILTTTTSSFSPKPKDIDSNSPVPSFFDNTGDLCKLIDLGFIYNTNAYEGKNSKDDSVFKHLLLNEKFRRSSSFKIEPSRRGSEKNKILGKKRASLPNKNSDNPVYNAIENKTRKGYTSIKNLSGLRTSMLSALYAYEGPFFQITSAKRLGDKSSNHYSGSAVDIHFNEDFIDYLLTNEGDKWLEDHDLQFFIEDNYRSFINDLPNKYKKHARYISHASNLHIHLELK